MNPTLKESQEKERREMLLKAEREGGNTALKIAENAYCLGIKHCGEASEDAIRSFVDGEKDDEHHRSA